MKCQMPGCKNSVTKINKKDGIFFGVHLNNVQLKTCDKHSTSEVDAALQKVAEKKAFGSQKVNPFAVSFRHKITK